MQKQQPSIRNLMTVCHTYKICVLQTTIHAIYSRIHLLIPSLQRLFQTTARNLNEETLPSSVVNEIRSNIFWNKL
jgi:hypothetical protein